MPKLLVFAVCEKVIIDQHNNVSLITLFQELTTELPDEPLVLDDGKKPAVHMKWETFALWEKGDGDENKEFEQRIALVDPSGEPTGIEATTAFGFPEGKSYMRNSVTVLGFPVHSFGRYVVRLWMRDRGEGAFAEPIAEFPITLKRQPPKD